MDRARQIRTLKPSHYAYTFLVSFLLSVFLLQWWQLQTYPLWICSFLGTVGALGYVGHLLRIKGSMLQLTMVIGIAFALMSVSRTTHISDGTSIETYAEGKTVTTQGIISDAPDDRQTSINYTVDVSSIQVTTTGSIIPVTGKVLVSDRRHFPRYRYDEEIEIRGQLTKPKATETFAYDNYLSRFGIYATMKATGISHISDNHGNPMIAGLIVLREHFEAQINRVFPEPQAAFLAGLLTGSRSGLPDHLTKAFKQTGLTHIVAISGFNITIIIAIISGCLFFLPLKWRFVPSVIAIILFTLFVGASASVVRASIMGILGLLALQTGRIRNARLAILWTAFCMLLWNPKFLWYDAGFQLSFLAVIGLTETAPILEQWMKKIPAALGIREALTMTIAAQVFAMPWIVLQFGTISLISPLANILVAPLIPFAMLFGFLGTVISFVSFPIGQVLGYIGWGCLELIILITTTLASLPFASVNIPTIGGLIVYAYYTVIIGGLWVLNYRKK